MMKTLSKRPTRRLRDYFSDRRGIAAVVFALMIPVLIASAGIGVDLAVAYNAKNRLSDALDKAVLAAGSSSTLSSADLQTRFTNFFNANYPSGKYFGTPYNVQLTVNGNTLTATASVKVPTAFMSLFGIDSINVSDTSQAVLSLAGVEAVLVLDVTGSMGVPQCYGCGTNMDSLKTASTDFLNIMFSKITDPKYLKIGIVPWNDTVNVGSYGWGQNPDSSYYDNPFVSPPATDDYITPASSITYDGTNSQTYEWWG
ncbi:MAG: pilus assembly protein, partial [Alphaproteobacteria bacterium]|nr:pilus assembly protein [Alphaproteobacteria bacterium]